jgi:hypothetical protein
VVAEIEGVIKGPCRGHDPLSQLEAKNAPFSTMGKPEPQIVVFTPAMRTLIADAIESLILLMRSMAMSTRKMTIARRRTPTPRGR